jgi:nucleotide-binding universal stress UspA family protein
MRILYATDGSEGALAGARLLAQLPLEQDCHLTLLTVVPDEEAQDGTAALGPARDLLCHTLASLHTVVRRGHPAEEILLAAESRPTDLIVVGSRGLSGLSRFLLGSVSDRVARYAPCPVLLARPPANDLRQVILGVDGSARAAQAAGWLATFPLPAEAETHLVSVLPPHCTAIYHGHDIWPALQTEYDRFYEVEQRRASEHLESLTSALTLAEKRATASVEIGDPAHTLLQVAERNQADLIVVGSHGKSALDRFLLGSVSEKVLRHADCSVVVVRGSHPLTDQTAKE